MNRYVSKVKLGDFDEYHGAVRYTRFREADADYVEDCGCDFEEVNLDFEQNYSGMLYFVIHRESGDEYVCVNELEWYDREDCDGEDGDS